MQRVTKEELQGKKANYNKILENNIFVHPTDSGYFLACNAQNKELVAQLRELKKVSMQPFAIIAPNKEWIYDNFNIDSKQKAVVEKLGKRSVIDGQEHNVTLVLELKNKQAIAKNVAPGLDTVAVRIPDHWIMDFFSEIEKPFVSTTANTVGGNFVTHHDDISDQVEKQVSLIIKDGKKEGIPNITFQPIAYKR